MEGKHILSLFIVPHYSLIMIVMVMMIVLTELPFSPLSINILYTLSRSNHSPISLIMMQDVC